MSPDAAAQKTASLPEWNLADLYPGPDSPELESDVEKLAKLATKFRESWQGKIMEIDGADLGTAIAEYEAMTELTGKIMSYAQLLHAGNVSDPEIGRFYQTLQERITGISTETLFFTLDINRLGEDRMAALLKHPKVAHYAPWLRDLRAFRQHQLADDMERLLHELDVSGRSAWIRLFDETMADLRFPFEGGDLTTTEIFDKLSDTKRDTRQAAAESIGKVLLKNLRLFSLITNTLAKDKSIDDDWRNYPRPVSARNLNNAVEDEVVDALVEAVREAAPRISHRYYAIKAKWLGLEKLKHWDRNAPLPEDDDRKIGWDEAKATVLDAYGAFSPDIRSIAERFFDGGWIDAPARPGKAGGAFAHPTVPSAHPYVLLNYQGRVRDVMTLAHELGHGVHQVLAGPQGNLMANTPLTLAETASVFGEMLTFQSMLKATTDPAKRKIMLAGKIEDMINTVIRQTAFYEFERRVHDARKKGELSGDQICRHWMDVQRESLGPAFDFTDDYRVYWTYIPHFIHSPFYVYAYAFGDCLVNALYDLFEEGHPAFQQKYLDMLSAGGVHRHKELLAPFGLDASDPAFWSRGLSVIERMIDQLEEL
ncbi:MAG: M3 family oligoendopeptidase [Rhodospirillales bacterium]